MPDDNLPEPHGRWDVLTATGAATPMGQLLRRYWWPIAGASEFDQPGTKPVRLMGEDLVLYKDQGGTYGLLDRHCRHRRADLSYGCRECGLRCNYHGCPRRGRAMPFRRSLRGCRPPEARLKDEFASRPTRSPNWAGSCAYSSRTARWCRIGNSFLAQRLPPDRPRGNSGNWFQCQRIRSTRCTRVDAFQLSVRPLAPPAPTPRSTSKLISANLNTASSTSGSAPTRPPRTAVDGRAGRLWPNAPFTGNHIEFRAGRRREHAERHVAFQPRAAGARALRAEPHPDWQGPIADPQTGR